MGTLWGKSASRFPSQPTSCGGVGAALMAVVSTRAINDPVSSRPIGASERGDGASRPSFTAKYRSASLMNDSLVCVGLDPDRREMPEGMSKSDFLLNIVEATKDIVCAYKPNSPFFEEDGSDGFAELEKVIRGIRELAPGIPVILDSKRADIGNTSTFFARSVFERFDADATVVNPYMGFDGLDPFAAYEDRHTFVLCRTSNRGARDFQDLRVRWFSWPPYFFGRPLYLEVAARTRDWGGSNVGLVVGATYPKEARQIRKLCPEMLFLVPGVGAQRAEVREVLAATGENVIVNSSRGVLYAGREEADYETRFPDYARAAAESLRSRLNAERKSRAGRREGAVA